MRKIALALGYDPGTILHKEDVLNFSKKAFFHLGKILTSILKQEQEIAGF